MKSNSSRGSPSLFSAKRHRRRSRAPYPTVTMSDEARMMQDEPVEVEPDEDEPMTMEWCRVTLGGDDGDEQQQPSTPSRARPASRLWSWSSGLRSHEPSPVIFGPYPGQQDQYPLRRQLRQESHEQPHQRQGRTGNLRPSSLALDDLLPGLTW